MTLAQSSTTIFQPGNIKLLIYGAIVVFMIVGRVVKAAKEAAERKRIEDSAKQAELEALRTGRPVPESASSSASRQIPELSAADRLQELAKKREQQLQAARARASVANAPQPKPRVASTPVPVRQPSPQQRVERQASRVRKATANTPPQGTRVEPAAKSRAVPELTESTTHRLVPDARPTPTTAVAATETGVRASREQLRRALVLREVIDPPLSLRD